MLAKAGDLPKDDGWGFELKWDGIRALAFVRGGKLRMQSRRMEDVTFRYPELAPIADALEGRDADPRRRGGRPRRGGPSPVPARAAADGADLEGRRGARRRQTPVDFVAFDLRAPRRARPARARPTPSAASCSPASGSRAPAGARPPTGSAADGSCSRRRRRRGLEGVVAKRLDSPYREGRRSGEWIKERIWREQEFVIGGHIPGEGRRAETVGSLLVGYYDKRASELGRGESQTLHFAGGVGSGLTQENLRSSRPPSRRSAATTAPSTPPVRGPKAKLAVFCEPQLVCQVSWSEWTDAGDAAPAGLQGHARRQGPARDRAGTGVTSALSKERRKGESR